MIPRDVFYARLALCRKCEFWRGACLKGHVLQGSPGCPVQKFEGVDGVGYMDDLPVPTPELPSISGFGCCGAKADETLKPLSWGEVWRHLMTALADWQKSGYPLVTGKDYAARISICRECPRKQYQWFQCRHCRCIVYSKAKLATEDCPFGLWAKLPVVTKG